MDWNYNGHNYTLADKNGDYYISYLPGLTGSPWEKLGMGAPSVGETALVLTDHNKPPVFFILNGDFRKEYEAAFPKGLAECKSIFLDNQDKKSGWSD